VILGLTAVMTLGSAPAAKAAPVGPTEQVSA